MSPLRQKMIEDLRLAGYSAKTVEAYVGTVSSLYTYFKPSPDRLNEEEIRQYFLYLKEERKVARSTFTQHLCGLKFFYEQTLARQWTLFGVVHPDRSKKLPKVLPQGRNQTSDFSSEERRLSDGVDFNLLLWFTH